MQRTHFLFIVAVIAFAMAIGASVSAQRGGAEQGPPPAARAIAPVDLTGVWTSIVTEDWRWRMITPAKGDYPSIPLTPAGRQVADQWDPAKDAAAGEQCRAFGAPGIMRMPGRVRISWENDNTLKVEAEAGTQTRMFVFGQRPPAAPEKTWQGVSAAQWQFEGGGRRGGGPPRPGSLRVVTR